MSVLISHVSTVHGVNVLNLFGKKERKLFSSRSVPKEGIAASILKNLKTKKVDGQDSEIEIGVKERNENIADHNNLRNILLRDRSAEEEMLTSQALYVIGRTAERTSPQFFIHFPLGDIFISRVLLPYVRDINPTSPIFYSTISSKVKSSKCLPERVNDVKNMKDMKDDNSEKNNDDYNNNKNNNSNNENYDNDNDDKKSSNTKNDNNYSKSNAPSICSTVVDSDGNVTLSVCAWVLLGALSACPTASLCQLVFPSLVSSSSSSSSSFNTSDETNRKYEHSESNIDNNNNINNNNTSDDHNNNNNNNNNNNSDNNGNFPKSSVATSFVVDVFFRVAYKIGTTGFKGEKDREEDSASIASGESYVNNPYSQNDKVKYQIDQESEGKSKRYLQLCVSYTGVLDELAPNPVNQSSKNMNSNDDKKNEKDELKEKVKGNYISGMEGKETEKEKTEDWNLQNSPSTPV